MGQKINPRSLRQNLWDRSHWAYYTSPHLAGVAWTQALKNVLTLHPTLAGMKRLRALKAPSRQQRKKPALWSLNHWLRWLPYSQWYHHYAYKLGSHSLQKTLSPLKMRYRVKARSRQILRRKSRCPFFLLLIGKMTERLNVPVWKTGFFKETWVRIPLFPTKQFQTHN